MIPRCPVTVYWHDVEYTARCVRPADHVGLHRDGVRWFNDHGLQRPTELASAAPYDRRLIGNGGWKERAGIDRACTSREAGAA